ncbi:protein mono-ADP-ribosyltransferase PARP14-like isoform X3 [Takifugu rubripes]|uniref:protein mono-ADP-ribosyltransferase PARP14-like isoform X3 n=1 Tax=Takifugu rubripes TaxID=31033 RepID=UPI001145B9EE|nr:protein mono-ADP-ribosyltransferase PARP14-like isoform X3 [Takifugu rubripes]
MAAAGQTDPSEDALLPAGLPTHGGSAEKLSPSAVNRLLMELLMYFGRAAFLLYPVYLSGYLGFSVSWVLLCMVMVTWWKKNRQWKDSRIGTAIEFVDNESQVVHKELRSALQMASWWFELEGVPHGEVHLKLQWLSLNADPSLLTESSDGLACAMLAVYLDSASNVPVGDVVAGPLRRADDVLIWGLVCASRKTQMKSTSRRNKKKASADKKHFRVPETKVKVNHDSEIRRPTATMEVSHDLLVELEENNICQLKNTLLRYFQSKKSSGGECEVDYKEGDRTAVLRFRREQDQKGVLEKGSHEITVDKCVLKMTVRLLTNEATVQATSSHTVTVKSDIGDNQAKREECVPAPKGQAHAGGGNDETAAEAACPTSALLANVPENNQKFLKLLVRNILKDGDSKNPVFSFEFLPDMTSAVVTFQSGKEASDFVARCPQNARFIKMGLSVQLLEVTHQVLVEGAENIDEEFLALYFEDAGGEVESVVVDEVDQSAIITFKEQKAAQNILKKKHTIDEKEIQVFAFHKSLGTALYGQEKPRLTLPKAINKAIDCAVWTYINSNQAAAESIRSALKEHFCIVNLDRATVCLSPAPTLKQHKNAKAIINQWGENVEATFVQSVSKFRCLNLSPESEAWEESTEVIRQMLLKEDVAVVPDKAKGVISVVGPVDVVEGVEQSLYEATNKIRKRVQRQKLSKTETVKMPPALLTILFQGGVKEELLSVYPELEISNRNDSPDLIVTGLVEDIVEVKKFIFNRMSELKYQKLDMGPFVLELLKEEQEEKLTDMFLRSHGINAALKISGNTLQLVAVTDGALVDAEDHLGKLLMSQYVDVEDSNVLKTPEWDEYVRQAENANNKLASRIRIRIKDQQVVVSGHKAVVINVSRELEDFLKQNAHVEETVAIKPDIILKHIKAFDKSHMEKLQDKVALSYKYEAICLSGSRADVLKSKSLVEKLVSSLIFEIYVVSVPGAKKLVQNLDSMNLVFNATGCLVELVDGTSGQGKPTNVPKPLCQLQTVDDRALDPNCLGQVQTKEGLNITLVVGNIEDATTDVTVNSVFNDLDLNRGALSRALLHAAGPRLQDFLKAQNSSGTLGEIIMTEGYQLKSMFVYHAVTPASYNAQAEKALKGIFRDCLKKAEDSGMTSISFPSIGTGGLGFPKDLAAQMLYDEILKFSSKRQTKRLAEVTIILYSGDTETQQAFTAELKKKISKDTVSGHFSKIVSSSGMYETKIGSVTIQAVTGDITKETTDVIVNSSNNTFSLKKGVSKAILKAAGQAVEDECQKLAASPNAGIIMTQPGNLQCKKIVHVTGQNKAFLISKVVKSALQMCVANSYTSVSFPAIGTGQGNIKATEVADAMFDAVIDELRQNSSTTLNTVRIVVFKPPMLNDFYTSMQQREASATKSASWLSKIKAFFTSSADKPQKEGGFIKSVEVEPVCFHICGKSQAAVDSAKKKINDLISKERSTNTIANKDIRSLSQADHQRLTDIQTTLNVKIMDESQKGTPSLTIEGLGYDVLKATNEILEMLGKAREREDLKVKMKLAESMAAWQYQQGNGFQNFDSTANYELEEALVNNVSSVDITIQGQLYTVQMPSGPATDKQGNSLQIRRTDKDEDIPNHWDVMPDNTSCHSVTLAAGSEEYKQVERKFQATCGQTIISIERIQNPLVWKTLQIKKRNMEQKNGHQNNERILFHGTSEETIATINANGFNRSYAGKNAALYGNGTYFAVSAQYSADDLYSTPNQNGDKHMYLCRVLTGDHTLGQQGMVAPLQKTSNSVELFDSAVDNQANPHIFVIFSDNQAYPEYLIKFK